MSLRVLFMRVRAKRPKGTALLQIIGHIPMGTSTIIERSGFYGLQIL